MPPPSPKPASGFEMQLVNLVFTDEHPGALGSRPAHSLGHLGPEGSECRLLGLLGLSHDLWFAGKAVPTPRAHHEASVVRVPVKVPPGHVPRC